MTDALILALAIALIAAGALSLIRLIRRPPRRY